jgi:hypothetical protein
MPTYSTPIAPNVFVVDFEPSQGTGATQQGIGLTGVDGPVPDASRIGGEPAPEVEFVNVP